MRHVEAFPPGFRMIAGDAKATSPQPLRITFWNCGVAAACSREHRPGVPGRTTQRAPPPCHLPELLGRQEPRQRHHQSHVAYPGRRTLPGDVRPCAAADLADLPLPGRRRRGVTLASGGQLSAMRTSSTRGARATCRPSSTAVSTRCGTASAATDSRTGWTGLRGAPPDRRACRAPPRTAGRSAAAWSTSGCSATISQRSSL